MTVSFDVTVNGNDVKGDWTFSGDGVVEWSWFQKAVKPKGKKKPVWMNAGTPIYQESWEPNYVTSQIDQNVSSGTYLYRLYGKTTDGIQLESGKIEVTI